MPDTFGAVPLGGPSNGTPRFERLSEQDRRDLEALAESTNTTDAQPAQTMFLVIVPEPGVAFATPDLSAITKYNAAHPASVPEMLAACGYVEARIHDSMLVSSVVATSMQTAAELQRRAADAKLVSDLGLNS